MEFLVNGATQFNEPGVFISFEESEKELILNSHSLRFDLKDLIDKKMLALDYVLIEPEKIVETGEFDLEGLFVRINNAIETVGAKRVALDTLESIFSAFGQTNIIRSEMSRLFRFLREKGVTSVVTAEAGEGSLSRHGLEEYVSDVVIALDHRVNDERAIRRLRIVKYRGSSHGTNEYPFLIDTDGLSVLPLTSVGLGAKASEKRISTGVPDLDAMMGGKGYFEGSTVLVTGAAGTGKTSLAAAFACKACAERKNVLYVVFEESANQIARNMKSIGMDLNRLTSSGLLTIQSERPSSFGLEMHLARIHKLVDKLKPKVVIFDPISALTMTGSTNDIKSMLLRIVDYLKMKGTTVMMTELRSEPREFGSMVSSLADTWIMLEDVETNGEKNRLLRVIKSRGMAHSNQVREIALSDSGISIVPAHISPAGVLTGTARYVQERKDEAERAARAEEIRRLKNDMKILRQKIRLQTQTMKMEMAEKESALRRQLSDETRREIGAVRTQTHMTRMRGTGRKDHGK